MCDFDLNVDFDSIESLDDLILYEDLIAFRLNQSLYLNYTHAVIWISNNYYVINILGHDKLVNTNQSIMKIGSYYTTEDINYRLIPIIKIILLIYFNRIQSSSILNC